MTSVDSICTLGTSRILELLYTKVGGIGIVRLTKKLYSNAHLQGLRLIKS
jgi:hypothetical protein